mgnify:FL=1
MGRKGFTLIEVVMIIVILGIIMPGIMLYFITGVKDSAIPQRRTTAIFLAEALMEEIKSKRWDEVTTINATCSNATLPLVAEEATRNLYDDIDDFNILNSAPNTPPANSQGTSMSDYPNYTQQAEIIYVNAGALDTSVAGPTCYKRILVRITDTTNSENIDLVSLMTSY